MKPIRSSSVFLFFSSREQKLIVEAIQKAEKQTSSEIRVHLDSRKVMDPMRRASEIFEQLGMTQTDAKNGVLIYLNIRSRRLVIIGDTGAEGCLPPGFWDNLVQEAVCLFKQDAFAKGLIAAIEAISAHLGKHFPYHALDKNELPDEISFSV